MKATAPRQIQRPRRLRSARAGVSRPGRRALGPPADTDHRLLIRRRVTALGVALALALGALLLRLIDVQVVQSDRLQALAQRQQLATILLQPHRGRVLDRRGRPLAINVEVPSIYAVPSAIPDRRAFAERAAPILGLRPHDVPPPPPTRRRL